MNARPSGRTSAPRLLRTPNRPVRHLVEHVRNGGRDRYRAGTAECHPLPNQHPMTWQQYGSFGDYAEGMDDDAGERELSFYDVDEATIERGGKAERRQLRKHSARSDSRQQ